MLNAQLAIEINAFGQYLHLFRRTVLNIFVHSLLDKSISEVRSAFHKSESQVEESEKKSNVLTKELDQVKCMTSALGLDVKQFSKSKRESNSTSYAMISDPNSSTRYRRR